MMMSITSQHTFRFKAICTSWMVSKRGRYWYVSFQIKCFAIFESFAQLGPCEDASCWWKQVRPMIQQRIEKYAANEIRFNLLAVCRNQRQYVSQMISQNCLNVELLKAALLSHGVEEGEDMQDLDENPYFTPVPIDLTGLTVEQLKQRLSECRSEINEYREILIREDEKAAKYKQENARRRHNFIPFIIELLKTLAANQKLQPLIDAAVKKSKSKAEPQSKS